MKKQILGACAVGLVALLAIGCFEKISGKGSNAESARERGREAAKKSVAAGKYMLKEYPPLPSPPGQNNYTNLLRTELGVDYRCPKKPADVSEKDFREEVRGWNEVMIPAIEKKFGKGVLGTLEARGQAEWRQSIGKPAKP